MFLIVSMKIHQGKYLLMKTLTFQVMIFRNCIQDQKVHLPYNVFITIEQPKLIRNIRV